MLVHSTRAPGQDGAQGFVNTTTTHGITIQFIMDAVPVTKLSGQSSCGLDHSSRWGFSEPWAGGSHAAHRTASLGNGVQPVTMGLSSIIIYTSPVWGTLNENISLETRQLLHLSPRSVNDTSGAPLCAQPRHPPHPHVLRNPSWTGHSSWPSSMAKAVHLQVVQPPGPKLAEYNQASTRVVQAGSLCSNRLVHPDAYM